MQEQNKSRAWGWLKHRPPAGLPAAAFWLALWFCVLLALRLLPGGWGTFFSVVQIFVGVALVIVAIPLLLRVVRRRMLWSLRNKLVVTYLLIGLAPVVLFVTLVLISAYIAAGQFEIHLADTRIQAELNQMSGENGHQAEQVARLLDGKTVSPNGLQISEAPSELDIPRLKLHRDTVAYVNGTRLPVKIMGGKTPLGLPPWASPLRGGEFHGMVLDGSDLYLVAVNQQGLGDGRMFSLVSSVPIDRAVMDMIADGLGRAHLFPAERLGGAEATTQQASAKGSSSTGSRSSIAGGSEPAGVNLADIRVRFLSTVGVTDWDTGNAANVPIEVVSRPSLLYNQLFGASLGGIVTSVIRAFLIVLCIVFAGLQVLALVMAIRLSRTMTTSVADLYEATQRIDEGRLDHRIGVTRDDQLAELSRSFNKMTGSLQRLLVEQKEKERLQNEISIAQEVQANLFPHQTVGLETLELHGVCRPARSVSGDYYDFLVFHEAAHNGHASPKETGVGIALGDISGKGISAALLMATLHSAVRAYRFASEELVFTESAVAGLMASRDERGRDCDELFESPGRILALLNRHLYRSTQPEKYATLFLAHYDVATSMLTYSNAGQLPPLVLGREGSIR
ncbi:MAG TPA: SpoIIE family protein phosphatase, partial [Edaphobacter sp.]